MSEYPFGKPVRVSPLIRGVRWGLLISGIIYGRMKQKIYSRSAAYEREEKARMKVIRDKEMEILKAKIAKEEQETVKMLETGKLFEPGYLDAPKGSKKCR